MNRNNFDREDIRLDDLHLNPQNPRIIDGCLDEKDCLVALLRNTENEILNLARNIAIKGIGPSLIVVIKQDNKYIVYDGNRRIAVLKMLNDPQKCPVKLLQEKFEKISAEALIEIPNHIECEVADSLTTASDYISLTHKGKQEGVGLSSWPTYLAARNAIQYGQTYRYAKEVNLIMWGEREGVIEGVDEEFKITNLERLIRFSGILNLMGFELDSNNNPHHLHKKQDAKKMLSRVYNDIKDRKIKARDIETLANAREYIQGMLSELSIARETIQTTKIVLPVREESRKTTVSFVANEETWMLKDDFKKLNFFMPSDETRARDIARELSHKSILNVEKAPNSVAILARTFIELSLDYYLLKISTDDVEKMYLKKRANKVIDDQRTKGIINEDSLKLYKTFFNGNKMLSFNTLNAFVHSKKYHPSPTDLKSIWKNIRVLIINCWKY